MNYIKRRTTGSYIKAATMLLLGSALLLRAGAASATAFGTIDGVAVNWTSYGASTFTESGGVLDSNNPNFYTSTFLSDTNYGPSGGDMVVYWDGLCVAGGGYDTFGWDFDIGGLNTGSCQNCNGTRASVNLGGWSGLYIAANSGPNATSTAFAVSPCDGAYKTYKFVIRANGGYFIFQDNALLIYSPDNAGTISSRFAINTQGSSGQYLWRNFTGNTAVAATPLTVTPTGGPFNIPSGGSAAITALAAGETGAASWRIDILDAGGLILQTYTGSGSVINQAWDGKNSAGVDQAAGSYTVRLAVWDTVANYHAADTTAVVVAPPTQSAHGPANSSTLTTTSPTVAFTASENSDCKWSLSDDSYDTMTNICAGGGTTSQSCPVTGLIEGSNNVYISCMGAIGNRDSSSSNTSLSYMVDTVFPTQSGHSPAGGATISATASAITFTLSENGSCKWALTDDTYAAMINICGGEGAAKSCAVTGLTQGANTISISCADNAGNSDTAGTNTDLSYTVDSLTPVQSAHSPAGGSTLTSTSTTVTLTLNENGSCMWALTDLNLTAMSNACAGGGATSQSCAVTGLAEGANIVSIGCMDAAGNIDTAGSNTDINYTVNTTIPDTTPPTQSAHSPASGASLISASQTITFSTNENGTCKWALTDLAYADMTNTCAGEGTTSQSCAVSGLAQGANTVSISCSDTIGNADSAGSNTGLGYTVDSVKPTQSAHSPASGSSLTSTSQAVTLTLSENGSCKWALADLDYAGMTNTCSGGGSTSQSCAVTGLAQGVNTVSISCSDAADNSDAAGSNTDLSYTVDSVKPTQSAHSPASGSSLTSTSQSIALTLSENGSCKWALTDLDYAGMTNTCSGGGTTSQSCDITGLAQGANTVSISCSDIAGNADTAGSNTALSYTVDSLSPVQSAHSPAPSTTLTSLAQTITLTLNENGSCKWALTDLGYDGMTNACSGGGTTSQSCAVTGLAEGAVIIYIACSDSSSNKDTATSNTELAYNVDTTAPSFSFVNDGLGADQAYATSASELSANWSAAAQSGIQKYEYAIGATAGGSDVVTWTGNGADTSVTKSGLTLTNGATYYFSVKAYSNVGSTAVMSSNGVKVDYTAPVSLEVKDDGTTTTDSAKLNFTLAASDAETGVTKIEYAIGSSTDTTDVRDWTDTSLQTNITATGLSLSAGVAYFIRARATNAAGLVNQAGVSDGITRVVGANVQFSYLPLDLNISAHAGEDASVPLEMIYKETGGASVKYDQLQRSYIFADGGSNTETVATADFTIKQSEELHVKDTVVIPGKIVTLALGASAAAKMTINLKYTGIDSAGNAVTTIFTIPVTLNSSESAVQFEATGVSVSSLTAGDATGTAAAGKITTKGVGTITGNWVVNGEPVKNFSIDVTRSGDTSLNETFASLANGDKVTLRLTAPVYKESDAVTYTAPSRASAVGDFWAGPFHVTGVKATTDAGAATLSGEGSVTLPLSDVTIKVPFERVSVETKDGKNVISGSAAVTGLQDYKVEKAPLTLSVSAVLLNADGVSADGTISIKGGNGVPGIGPLNFFGLKISDQGFSGQIKFDPPQKGKIGVFSVNIENVDFTLQQSQTTVKVTGYFFADQNGVLYVKLPMVIENQPGGGLKFSAP